MGINGVEEEEPLSPNARVFQTKRLNCCIIAVIGCKTRIDVSVIKLGLEDTLIKHPRFSSLMVMDEKGGKMKWSRTKVNVENHVIVPNLDPNINSINSPDQFVEDYVSNLTKTPINLAKPLWELHILNLQTSDATSVVILKVHHSIGDGMSLISLLLACTRKTSDPNSLPTISIRKRQSSRRSGGVFGWLWWLLVSIWWWVVVLVNTFVDVVLLNATLSFLKDDPSPIKGGEGVGSTPKRLMHRIVKLDDVKLVKNAANMTINDVILGVTQAGLSRYLKNRYASENLKNDKDKKKGNNLPEHIRLRAALMVNIRPSTGIEESAKMMEKESKIKWGNWYGYVIIPIKIGLHDDDPLKYVIDSKAVIDRKKHSFEAICTFLSAKFVLNLFGVKAAGDLVYKVLSNTTMSFSNVVGPQEEISFYGHPITYIAPTVYGHPHALTIHWQSYANKLIIALAVDEDIIPDPHRLCDDIEDSLQLIKQTCIHKYGLTEVSV